MGASRSDTRAGHKHEIRRFFHPQIKKLWEVTPRLNDIDDPVQHNTINAGVLGEALPAASGRIASLARRFSRGSYGFVPLVTKDLFIACGIDILFLRPDPPGEIVRSGDIDNRLKTLLDALRVPTEVNELGQYQHQNPDQAEIPFFCLLEDDSLISRLSVETDMLLQSVSTPPNANDARVIVSVTLRPSILTWGNMGFA
jgi:hypothetical protein